MDKTAIHIADASEISRRGLISLMESFDCAGPIFEYSSAESLVRAYRQSANGVCVISSNLVNSEMDLGCLMEKLCSVNPGCGVLIVAESADIGEVNTALKQGIRAYVTRRVSAEELEKIVIALCRGDKAFSRDVSESITKHYSANQEFPLSINRDSITKREQEILSLVVQGLTSSEIAKQLYISPRTVETHRSNLMHKLNIKNTAGLVRYALQEGNYN
ncbi:MAG: hypothetical protein GVY08_02015 [Bacteroidetes bacterium]|jgi:DNA-binding NarL/FixJ family response regulator|nr:hypothetical protein [Bacteroidota bacterium]